MLGAEKRREGYLEGNGYVVSWCFGHLIELAEPGAYDSRYAKWRREDLPILPEEWQYLVTDSTKKQYEILNKLLHREDVASVVNACDAGREGELIFRLVYSQSGCTKPMERLWISSMEDSAIREGVRNLRPGAEYDRLYEAALCRERADWIVGINATRLFSCLYRKTLNIGRVMTPTLGMVVLRDAQAKAFRPEPFYTVQIDSAAGTVSGERIKDSQEAKELQRECADEGKVRILVVDRREKCERPPLPYDLTSLQRDANRILGFTAQQTLDYTQSLYEKKLVTYPRTDSRYLTEDMREKLPELIGSIRRKWEVCDYLPDAVNVGTVCDSSKVTDHHAIIPTAVVDGTLQATLPFGEAAVLTVIVCRLLCAVSAEHRYAETEVRASCAGSEFTSRIKEVLNPGWHAIRDAFYPPKKKEPSEQFSAHAGETVPIKSCRVTEGKTSPPERYTEDTLLSSMQNAAREELPEETERHGIGTPATRAGIIEKLVQKGYIERVGTGKSRHLTATEKGQALITVMPEQIQSPSMTADWEQKLLAIEHGEYAPEQFMAEIRTMVRDLVTNTQPAEGAEVLMAEKKVIGKCPHCGSEVVERQKGWFCADRSCRFVIWKDNAFFRRIGKRPTAQMLEHLLLDGHVRLKDCRQPDSVKTYNATLNLATEGDGRPVFRLAFENGGANGK